MKNQISKIKFQNEMSKVKTISFTKQNLFIKNRYGENLEALLRKPEAKGKFPTVLFVSGFGMDLHEYKNSNDEISELLANMGFLTLQFSFAGRGNSEGDYRQITLERQGKQIEDVTKWLTNQDYMDKKRLGLFAQSFGAPSSLCADLSKFKTIIFNGGAFFPGRSLRQVFIEERDVKVEDGKDVSLPRSDGSYTVVGKQFFPNIDKFDPILKVRKLTQPVFLIHGSNDTKVKTEEVEKVFRLIPSVKKKQKVFIGGDHCISDSPYEMRQEFLTEVVEWFRKTL